MNTQKPSISIIEDNEDLLDEMVFFLQQHEFKVWGTTSAEQFWKKLHLSPVDIVIVDIGLPGEDGFTVVEHLKRIGQVGIIIATALGQEQNKLRGLNIGADLYLVKPVNFSELVSSIDGLWLRMQQECTPEPSYRTGENSGKWALISVGRSLLTPTGEVLKLSVQEYQFISTLVRSPYEIFTKTALLSLIFCYDDEPDPHRIDVILNRLRKKSNAAKFNLPVRSIFGKGLVFFGAVEERSVK